ncbi:MAG: hypothetical protein ACTHJR_07895 [Sphingomonas sp.]|uniref:hypothetical protein n=1 Tax=Sphingomonas sp. TaxID=28214 RepID=UPI003F81A26E
MMLLAMLAAYTAQPNDGQTVPEKRIIFCQLRKFVPSEVKEVGPAAEEGPKLFAVMFPVERGGTIDVAGYTAHDPNGLLLGMRPSAIRYDKKRQGYFIYYTQPGSTEDAKKSLVFGVLPRPGTAVLDGHLAWPDVDANGNAFSYVFEGLCDSFVSKSPDRDFETVKGMSPR